MKKKVSKNIRWPLWSLVNLSNALTFLLCVLCNRIAQYFASLLTECRTKKQKWEKNKHTQTIWISKIILFIFMPHFPKHRHYLHDCVFFFFVVCTLLECLVTFGYVRLHLCSCINFFLIQSIHLAYKAKQVIIGFGSIKWHMIVFPVIWLLFRKRV